jgi:translation initiation factor eIF-2B subunit delta
VLLSESRPAYDGRSQATALLTHGLEVEYGIDMALFARIPDAQAILVGADAVFPHGLVNKLGTHPLAQIARLHQVPIFSLCTSGKFLPATAGPLVRFVDQPGHDVWPDAPLGVHLYNRYFDLTPLPLFSGIVSEDRVYTPTDLRTYLERRELAPALLRLASDRAPGDDHGTFPTHRTGLERLEEY